jgi:rhodanese-related sulfurtransferase
MLPLVEEGEVCAAGGAGPGEVTVQELAAVRRAGGTHVLLDVREDWELAVARVEPCLHIPLGQLPARIGEVPRGVPIYAMCHAGVRSAKAVDLLARSGFAGAVNVRGGIAAWSREVDPSVPDY